MTYHIMTGANVLVSLLLALACFIFMQTKTIDMRDRAVRRERERSEEVEFRKRLGEIKPGDVYRLTIEATPFEPERTIDYEIKETRDGYVNWSYPHIPGSRNVERATEFLKCKVKVKAREE